MNFIIFDSDSVKRQEAYRKRLTSIATERIQSELSVKLAERNLTATKFQALLFAVSAVLSDRGIAPQWQNLADLCSTKEQYKVLDGLKPLIDLYWLSVAYPKHKTKNKRWQSLFANGFTFELANSIVKRQLHWARKTLELDTTVFQQLGCLRFVRSDARKKRAAARKKWETAYKKALNEFKKGRHMTAEEFAEQRAYIRICYELAEGSPTNAAILIKQMTGKTIDKANINRTAKAIGIAHRYRVSP